VVQWNCQHISIHVKFSYSTHIGNFELKTLYNFPGYFAWNTNLMLSIHESWVFFQEKLSFFTTGGSLLGKNSFPKIYLAIINVEPTDSQIYLNMT